MIFNVNPLIGVSIGSVPMTGGHGTSGAFAPVFESAGAVGASAVAMASATFGLIAGSIIEGPIGKRLIERNNLLEFNDQEHKKSIIIRENLSKSILESEPLFKGACQIILAMGFGSLFWILLQYTGITFPPYLGAMFAAVIIRNITDYTRITRLHLNEISVMGEITLSLFVAMALMNMKLWQLTELAGTMITTLIAQTIVMATFAYFVTFNAMGRNYEAAVMACGHCGFGMGATPNALINMNILTKQYRMAPAAFIILPIVGSLFIDFFNASIITVFVNVLG